jgi:hypothetical protein
MTEEKRKSVGRGWLIGHRVPVNTQEDHSFRSDASGSDSGTGGGREKRTEPVRLWLSCRTWHLDASRLRSAVSNRHKTGPNAVARRPRCSYQ